MLIDEGIIVVWSMFKNFFLLKFQKIIIKNKKQEAVRVTANWFFKIYLCPAIFHFYMDNNSNVELDFHFVSSNNILFF